MSLIKTGRSPANMAHPSFSQQRTERKKKKDWCASGTVASHGSSSLCSRSSLSFPWLCLSRECLNGQGSLCHSSLTFLLRGSHVTLDLAARSDPHRSSISFGLMSCCSHSNLVKDFLSYYALKCFSWSWKQELRQWVLIWSTITSGTRLIVNE